MKIFKTTLITLTFCTMMISTSYAQNVPENITTPDVIQTQTLGELNFKDGYPSDETMSKVQQYMFIQRAVNVFVDGIPISSLQALLEGAKSIGSKPNRSVTISESLMDANSLFLTPNTTTPYVLMEFDVKKGPMVIDVHSPVLGLIDDAFFEYVGDVGVGNPKDGGKGGKYLLVHDSYKGNIPDGYIVFKTQSYRHWGAFRLDSVDGIQQFKDTFSMYPLGTKPYKIDYINSSGKKYNTVHANNEEFYHELNEVIQYEPLSSGDPHFRGLAAAIGIQKGKEFNPKGEQLLALKEAAAIANVHARNEAFRPTNSET